MSLIVVDELLLSTLHATPAGATSENPNFLCSRVDPRGHRDLHFIALCEDSTSYSGGCVLYLSRAVYVYPLESQTADNAIGMYPLPSW